MRRASVWFGIAACALLGCGDESGVTPQADAGPPQADTSASEDASAAEDAGAVDGSCAPAPGACERFDASVQPPRLSEFTTAYVESERAMYVFGGSTAVPPPGERPPALFTDALWRFDDACTAWEEVNASGGPSARGRAMATDGPDGFYVFGGRWREDGSFSGDYALYQELWFFEAATATWELLSEGEGPSARVDGVLETTPRRPLGARRQQPDSGLAYVPLQDTWTFEARTWSRPRLPAPPAPLRRDARYPPPLIVGGGGNETASSTDLGDLYALDMATGAWSRSPSPSAARSRASGASSPTPRV